MLVDIKLSVFLLFYLTQLNSQTFFGFNSQKEDLAPSRIICNTDDKNHELGFKVENKLVFALYP